jgi:hypothetical protein
VKSDEDGDDRPPIVRPLGMQTRWEPTVASRTITAMAEPRSWDEVAAGLVVDVSLFLCSYAPFFAILATLSPCSTSSRRDGRARNGAILRGLGSSPATVQAWVFQTDNDVGHAAAVPSL